MPGLEGKTLNRYALQQLVGKGGMADVYKGYDTHFDRSVAVKVFKREDEEMLRRFIREARLMATFHNEHLVPIYDAGQYQAEYDTRYYIVMPFMEGGTLRARIRQSPLSLNEACRALNDIADALDYIHRQGIVHRDIKASNVLLDAQGKYYLSDFGIARIASDATQLTTTGNVLGTVDYIAPELFEDNRRADARSDLYSLGVLLFEMVTGQLPFSAENQLALVTMHMHSPPPSPGSILQNISPQVDRVILKALEKKPEQRYGSATELAEAFCLAVVEGDHEFRGQPQGSPMQWTKAQHDSSKLPAPMIGVPPAASRQIAPPPVPPDPPRPRTGNQRARIAVVTTLAMLLIISLVTLLLLTQTNGGNSAVQSSATQTQTTPGAGTSPTLKPAATPNLTATARVIAAATATARAHATATAIARVTATAQAQARATAGVIQTATSGTPAYQDTLNNAANADTQAAQWDTNTQCAFKSDGYHVSEGVNLVDFHGCREAGKFYQNAVVSVGINIISGHSGGLFFRLNTDILNRYAGYLFEIDSKGNYKISVMDYATVTALPGHDWTPSASLKRGYNVKNTLVVIIRGNTFLFYANGAFLTQVTDATYGAQGTVAFLATTTDTPADIDYSNLKIYPQP
jgi:eukaryotic-like serine/threonine-protein kinase